MSDGEDIDEQLEAQQSHRGISRHGGNENAKSARRIAEVLIGGALLALGGAVWTLKGAVEAQQTSVLFVQKQIDTLQDDQKETRHKVDEMSGRMLRGIAEGKDPYAPDKQ